MYAMAGEDKWLSVVCAVAEVWGYVIQRMRSTGRVWKERKALDMAREEPESCMFVKKDTVRAGYR